jgi:hypothetical protein
MESEGGTDTSFEQGGAVVRWCDGEMVWRYFVDRLIDAVGGNYDGGSEVAGKARRSLVLGACVLGPGC